jgi:hypothetical protein
MEQNIFTIRKSFLLPLGLVVLLTLVLLISCIYLQLPLAKTLILGAFILPAVILFAESSRRRICIGETNIQFDKLFRSKQIYYHDLTSIDTVLVRKRAFVSLSTEEDFVMLSNSYANFATLLQQLLARVPESIISTETRHLASNPPEKSSDIFSVWVAVAVLALIIYVQLRGAF